MKKTEFFTADDTTQLQQSVNTWLSANKDISIIETGMTTTNSSDKSTVNFYILYEAVEAAEAIAVSQQIENVIPEPGSLSETTDIQLQ